MNDTIFARATARGRAAIAIIRVSGPESAQALIRLAGGLPKPRHAAVRQLRDAHGELIDESLILWMPGPHSFTGEDSAEFQVHGGEAVVDALSETLLREGLRPADPGEFSRRAFANGRMDLLQAEAVADLVDAQTAAQRRQALAQMAGGVGRRFEQWRGELIEALALLEAENDFPDEDLPGALALRAVARLKPLSRDLEQARATSARGRGIREGYRIAIIGEPNVGKSSLFNALIGRPAAIVSGTPGTTRDVVEASTLVGGHLVTLADTAGMRTTVDEVEAEGVRRAQSWARNASVRLLVVEGNSEPVEEHLAFFTPGDLVIRSKSDLVSFQSAWPAANGHHWEELPASTVTEEGLQQVRGWLHERVSADLNATEPPFSTRARHEEAITEALEAISDAQVVAERSPERAVEDLRRANQALRSIVGDVDREAVLDRVFSSFCIGK